MISAKTFISLLIATGRCSGQSLDIFYLGKVRQQTARRSKSGWYLHHRCSHIFRVGIVLTFFEKDACSKTYRRKKNIFAHEFRLIIC